MYHLQKEIKGQGENITLNNTSEARFKKFGIGGNSKQEGEPTRTNPSEIKNVTGNANIKITNNLESTDENYKEQSFTFPLAEGQRLMKNDYLADDEIHHKRKQKVFDGTENWIFGNIKENTVNLLLNDFPGYNATGTDSINAICNYFVGITQGASLDKECFWFNGSGGFRIRVNKDRLADTSTNDKCVESFKSLLAELYANGTPVVVEYDLAEEEIEPYTTEQQAVYNKIKNTAKSYGDITHIFSTDEISPIFDVIAYKKISDEIKYRILNGKVTRGYLKVLATNTKPEMIIDENNYLKDCTFEELRYVPDEGFIGGTVAKRVTGNFNNVDSFFSIQDREFELYLGVDLEDGTTEYIKYGTFIVQKPEDDQVNDNTSFEALDYMIKLNLPWVDRMTYPCTLKELFDDLVAQSGLSTKVTSFLNQNFIVENNQFEEGTTRRDVLKAIAQMAFNWARIDEDNDIVMDFEKKDEVAETLTADNYYNFKKQDMYGPINVIVLRNSQVEGENITIRDEESIAQYGETELVISDNPFAYTQAKRAELIEAGKILFGLTYIPMSMDMIGYMYLNCKDKIKATNLNNETFETYLLNHTIEYAGTISDSMEAPASTKTETQYQFTPPMIEALKHTELLVDKANQRIDAVIKNISDTNSKIVEMEATLDGVTTTVQEIEQKTDETANKVDNLRVGTRNLLLDSNRKITNSNYPIARYKLTISPKEGDEYTFSLNGSLGEGKTDFRLYNTAGQGQNFLAILKYDEEEDLYKATFKWKEGISGNTYLNIYPAPNSVTSESTIEWVKLEEGNMNTGWTQAPEDIEIRFTETDNAIQNVEDATNDRIDNLKSGANNLIVNSGYFNNTDGWRANGNGVTLNIENFDGFNCIKATGSIAYAYDELPLYNAGFIRLEPNSTYIIQLEMYLYRELAEGETDITYPITNSNPLHTYINSMKSTGVVMSGNNAIDSENGASVKKTLLSSSSYKTNEWVKIQLKIETGNPTLDYPYYAIKPFIWRSRGWNNRRKYCIYEEYIHKRNKYNF